METFIHRVFDIYSTAFDVEQWEEMGKLKSAIQSYTSRVDSKYLDIILKELDGRLASEFA